MAGTAPAPSIAIGSIRAICLKCKIEGLHPVQMQAGHRRCYCRQCGRQLGNIPETLLLDPILITDRASAPNPSAACSLAKVPKPAEAKLALDPRDRFALEIYANEVTLAEDRQPGFMERCRVFAYEAVDYFLAHRSAD